jgi:TetR/AcrR family transcriptional repressor of nem operon
MAEPATDNLVPTKARILEAARRLFHAQGFEASGVAAILREAGVNAGSLYHYFPSKEALLAGVLEYYVGLLRPVVMDPVEEVEADPIGRVFELLAQYREGMEHARCTMGCPIGNLALEVADRHPEARGLIDLNFRNWAAAVEAWLVDAGDRLPRDCDRRGLARLVLAVMEGGIVQARAASSLEPFDACVAQLRAYFDMLQEQARRERRLEPSHA